MAWKGSEAILGPFLDPDVKEQLDNLRGEINGFMNEEAMLDQWITNLNKVSGSLNLLACGDIVEALYYPAGLPLPSRDDLVDETGKPRQSLLAIHAPYESLVQIPSPEYEGQSECQLFIGTKDPLRLCGDAAASRKRKLSYDGRLGSRVSRADGKVEVYALSTHCDGHDKIVFSEVKDLANDVVKERSSSWDLAESLANDEGVSDFIVSGEEEAV